MFCTKLKDLKITGECPFSLLTQSRIADEHEKDCTENSSRAALPICKEVHEKDTQGNLPQRKTSRSRVYLHTLTESICKLIFPEVNGYCVSLYTLKCILCKPLDVSLLTAVLTSKSMLLCRSAEVKSSFHSFHFLFYMILPQSVLSTLKLSLPLYFPILCPVFAVSHCSF